MSRKLGVSIGLLAGVAGGVVGGIILYNHHTSGEWKMPTGDDLVRIKSKLVGASDGPSKVIYLERGGVTLTAGIDDAPRGVSSVVAAQGVDKVTIPRFRGSDKDWSWIVTCVSKKFEDFDVEVTDVRPRHDDYLMVVVGGKASDLSNGKHRHAGGLAPFNTKVIPRAVVFAFAESLRRRKREICEVIGMEVGHAFGLDHGFHCRDLMTYLNYCGYKRFQDMDVPCGEDKRRPCADGQPTQNSYRRLLGVLGAARR